MTLVEELAKGLLSGRVRVVDLSQSLSEDTIVIELPPPFAQSAPFRKAVVSAYDD